MQTTATKPRDIKSHSSFKVPDRSEGLHYNLTVMKSPSEVFEFLKQEQNHKLLLQDLPKDVTNFFDFKVASSTSTSLDNYEIKLENKADAKVQGSLLLTLRPGPTGKGSVVSATGKFGSYTSKDEGPSDLLNVFLKRVKAMVETKQIATTKGQSNGNEEVNENLKH